MLARYRADTSTPLPPDVCLAVAGPVHGDAVSLTNNDWNFSVEQLRRRHKFRHVSVINDLAAVACATRFLDAGDVHVLRHGRPDVNAPRVVVGAGTGLGVAALLQTPSGWQAAPSESGHSPFAPGSQEDRQVLDLLLRRMEFVSWESLLSGPGLVHWYEAFAMLGEHEKRRVTPMEISVLASQGDALSMAATRAFCRTAARFASAAALWFCSFGGVYLSGDIFRSLGRWLAEAEFFDASSVDRAIEGCVESMPVSLILAEQPSLIGAAATAHHVAGHVDTAVVPSLIGAS